MYIAGSEQFQFLLKRFIVKTQGKKLLFNPLASNVTKWSHIQ